MSQPESPPPPSGDDRPWLTPSRLLSLVAVLVGTYAALVVIRALRGVLIMLLMALFLSFAMEPAVQFLARRGWRRGAATAAVFLGVALVSAGFIAAMVPLIVGQATELVRSIPTDIAEINANLLNLPFGVDLGTSSEVRAEVDMFMSRLTEQLQGMALGAAGNVVDFGATAVGALFQLLTVALVTFYLVADGPSARRVLARPLPPERQREMLAIWELAVAKTGGYIYSRLLLAVVSAVAHLLFLLALGVPFPVPLALWVGLTSAFVPVIGTYLGGVLIVIVALLHEPIDALWVLVFVALYQQAENYLVAPKIQSHTMEIHPALAFVSVIIGATLLGAPGALLALPATAIIQAVLSTFVNRHELIDELADMAPPEVSSMRTSRERQHQRPPYLRLRDAMLRDRHAKHATNTGARRDNAAGRGSTDEEAPV